MSEKFEKINFFVGTTNMKVAVSRWRYNAIEANMMQKSCTRLEPFNAAVNYVTSEIYHH
jgi:hypothetical protein